MITRTILLVLCLAAAACGGDGTPTSPSGSPSTSGNTPGSGGGPSGRSTGYAWEFNGSTWAPAAGTTPPVCPGTVTLRTPVDLAAATSILYPGQVRGGDYKAHGGFRFDRAGQTNDVRVIAPLEGMVYRGARYIESGEEQFLFDVLNACGVMYRFDHLRTLTPRFQQIAAAFPARSDSRTTPVAPGEMVAAGESIATAVGHVGNVGFDWGVYDLRQPNMASRDAGWVAQHDGEYPAYAVCWLDWLSPGDSALARSLPPGDGASGSMSDYCR